MPSKQQRRSVDELFGEFGFEKPQASNAVPNSPLEDGPWPKELVDAVLGVATSSQTEPHGPVHWYRVARNGETLARATTGADRAVVRAFSLIHDAMRVNDDHDPDHGRRAAKLARDLTPVLGLAPKPLRLLQKACELHADGQTSPDPTIGVCWDADRLDLPRVGIQPRAKLLSTFAGRKHTRKKATSYYHGGVAGLKPGDRILPPAETGAKTWYERWGYDGFSHSAHLSDRVYIATNLSQAATFAVLDAGHEREPELYRVEPDDPVGLDPDYPLGDCYSAPAATVIEKIYLAREDIERALTLHRLIELSMGAAFKWLQAEREAGMPLAARLETQTVRSFTPPPFEQVWERAQLIAREAVRMAGFDDMAMTRFESFLTGRAFNLPPVGG